MRFSEDFIDTLKDRVSLSDYIGRKVKLVKSGKHWKGLSPFKPEKTPSFMVDDEKRSFVCYSSGISGDIISFVQETEGLSFTEAVEKLARDAGLEIPTDNPQNAQKTRKRKSLMDLMEATVAFYEQTLRSDVGLVARRYLDEARGLDEAAWRRHRIGFAPDGWQSLYDHLKAQGAEDAELIDIGVSRPSNKAGKPPYDAFRNRVIFPILDPSGRPIALGGRALESSAVLKERGIPKYVNSSDTPLFHKSRVIYGYGPAREALHKASRNEDHKDPLARGLIVAEGYMDVIAMIEHGFETAVAPMGTALTNEQLEMLWRAGPEPIMCFDGDTAGINAAMRAADLALPHLQPGRSLYFTLLPEGMDPDDLLKKEDGVEQLGDLLRGARPLVDLIWDRELAAEPLDTPERRAGFEARLNACIAKIEHEQVRIAYQRELKDRLFKQSRAQRQTQSWTPGKRQGGYSPAGPHIKFSDVQGYVGRSGLGMVVAAIDCPPLLEEGRDQLALADFADEDVSELRNAALDVQDSCGEVDRSVVAAHLRSLGRTRSAKMLEEYPMTEPIDLARAEGREWLAALERFPTVAALKDEANATKGALASASGVEFAAEWARRKRLVAERQALKARSQQRLDDDPSSDQDL